MVIDPSAPAAVMTDRRENWVAIGCLRLNAHWGLPSGGPGRPAMMLMNAEARVSRRDINQPQLHPFDPVPAVEAQRAGGVHGSPAALPERDPELLSGGAKRDGVDDRAVAGAQPRAHVRLPYLLGIDEGMGRQRNDRFGIARAERTRARDRRHDVVVGGTGGECPIDQQRILAPRSLDRARERTLEIGAERAQGILA